MKTKQTSSESWGELLAKYSHENISHMEYEEKENVEAVIVHFRNGYSKAVDITGDSCLGIMTDLGCRLS